MHITNLFSLVFFVTLASRAQAAADDCCRCSEPTVYGQCGDGTKCTPYCGYGPCNIFGCNCDRGCRHTGLKRARSSANTNLAATDAIKARFNAADAKNDLTLKEWAASDETKDMDRNALAAHWAKFDSAGVGYLTEADVASRIA